MDKDNNNIVEIKIEEEMKKILFRLCHVRNCK